MSSSASSVFPATSKRHWHFVAHQRGHVRGQLRPAASLGMFFLRIAPDHGHAGAALLQQFRDRPLAHLVVALRVRVAVAELADQLENLGRCVRPDAPRELVEQFLGRGARGFRVVALRDPFECGNRPPRRSLPQLAQRGFLARGRTPRCRGRLPVPRWSAASGLGAGSVGTAGAGYASSTATSLAWTHLMATSPGVPTVPPPSIVIPAEQWAEVPDSADGR